MAKSSNSDFTYNIESFIGSLKESDKHDWCKSVLRISWGENPPTLDIRNVNMAQKRIGKGISLSNEEVDKLVNILLDNDYGSLENLEQAITRKREIFSLTDDIDRVIDNDEKLYIDIRL